MRLYRNVWRFVCFLDYRLTKKLVGAPLYSSSNIHVWTSIASVVTEVYFYNENCERQTCTSRIDNYVATYVWLVLSRFVHCVSVPVAMYCWIEWCISQLQSALVFRLAQLHVPKIGIFMSHSGGSGLIVARLLSRMVRTYTKQFID